VNAVPLERSLLGEALAHGRKHRCVGPFLRMAAHFNHSVHVAKGVGCSTCHGEVQTMKLMRQAAPLTMGWCLDCHREPRAARAGQRWHIEHSLSRSVDLMWRSSMKRAPIAA
jgi:hypothetical protein